MSSPQSPFRPYKIRVKTELETRLFYFSKARPWKELENQEKNRYEEFPHSGF